jgi:hypothetical protein
MTTENLIRLLTAKSEASYKLSKFWKKEHKLRLSHEYRAESHAYQEIACLLADPDYAQKIWCIYFPGEVLE